jgi:hypothetical protein
MKLERAFEIKLLSKMTQEEVDSIEGARDAADFYGTSESCSHRDLAFVLYKDRIINVLDEKMEPEDVSFRRDLGPYLRVIEKAFALGVSHGVLEASERVFWNNLSGRWVVPKETAIKEE